MFILIVSTIIDQTTEKVTLSVMHNVLKTAIKVFETCLKPIKIKEYYAIASKITDSCANIGYA